MTHVSKHEIDEKIKEFIFERFVELLASVKNKKDARALFDNMFTETERIMFAKRLAIAYMVHSNKGFWEIENILKVSPTTISKIIFEKEKGKLIFVEKFLNNQKTIWQMIDKVLYAILPPRVGMERYSWTDKF